MKLKSLLAVALAATLLASCSKDTPAETHNGERGKETTMKITLTQAGVNSRNYHTSMTATTEESQINNVRLYVFDNLGVLEAVEDFTANTSSKVFEITTGTKMLFAAVNIPTALLPTTTIGSTTMTTLKTEVVNGITNIDVAAFIDDVTNTDHNFWMTSVNDSKTATIVEASKDDVENLNVNNVTIEVGRTVAKIGVYFNPTTELDGNLTSVQYKVHNNPNALTLVPQLDATGLRMTPYYGATVINATNYFHNTIYRETYLDSGVHDEDAISYMTENSNKDAKKGNTTFTMIKGVFTPSKWYKLDGLGGIEEDLIPAATGDTFWRIANVDVASNPIDYEEEYYSEDPTTLLAAGQEIREYLGGVCYYGLWLSDPASDTQNKYTVKRNTYWSVEITSVNGAGANDPDEVVVDPDEKLDVDTHMKATIVVQPWEKVTQSGGI